MCDAPIVSRTFNSRGPFWFRLNGGGACATFWNAKGWLNRLAWAFRGLASHIDGLPSYTLVQHGPDVFSDEEATDALAHGLMAAADYLNDLYLERTVPTDYVTTQKLLKSVANNQGTNP